MIREAIGRRFFDAGERLRVRSALNPALWLCVFVTVPCLYIFRSQIHELPIWIIAVIVLPVATAVIGYLYFLFFDRDKLQSEDYQIRMRSLELIQEKGETVPVVAASIDAISNPDRRRLDGSHSGDSEK